MSMNCGCLFLSTVSPFLKLVSKTCNPHSRTDTSKLGVHFFTDSTDVEQDIDVLYSTAAKQPNINRLCTF